MTRRELIYDLERYCPFNEQEEKDKALILNWIKTNDNAFSRENAVAHITASAWVVNKDRSKVLNTTTFTTPGPGWAGTRMAKPTCWLLPFAR